MRKEIDLLAPELYAGDPYPTYAWMRANEPVYWDDVNELWGIARYDDIVRDREGQGRRSSTPTQEKGGYRPNLPADPAIIGLDDPLHLQAPQPGVPSLHPPGRGQLGGRHPAARSPACSTRSRPRAATAEIVDELAAPLPAMMIGKLLGFDEERLAASSSTGRRPPSPWAAAPATSPRTA